MRNFKFKPKYIPVCAFPYAKSYYLARPWKWLADAWDALKALFHRALYGFAPIDAWDMDSYMCTLVPSMLRTLADRSWSYPGNEEFPTLELYEEWLLALATIIECAQTTWPDEADDLEKARKAIGDIEGCDKLKESALDALDTEDWYMRLAAIGFTELGTHLHWLWD